MATKTKTKTKTGEAPREHKKPWQETYATVEEIKQRRNCTGTCRKWVERVERWGRFRTPLAYRARMRYATTLYILLHLSTHSTQ